jgi:hypothetical protein
MYNIPRPALKLLDDVHNFFSLYVRRSIEKKINSPKNWMIQMVCSTYFPLIRRACFNIYHE